MYARRTIYSCDGGDLIEEARPVRSEGEPPTGDAAVDRAYDHLETIYNYFRAAHYRDSVDGRGGPLRAYVHYGVGVEQAFLQDGWIVVGDAQVLFHPFTSCPTAFFQLAGRAFLGISGPGGNRAQNWVLHLALGNVFACLIDQFRSNHTAANATWLVGAGMFRSSVAEGALYSLAAPGTANTLGDRQLARWRTPAVLGRVDEGLAGVPAHAFYLFAREVGGHAWDRAGSVWYQAASTPHRRWTVPNFARTTCQVAAELYGRAMERAQREAWRQVGVLERG